MTGHSHSAFLESFNSLGGKRMLPPIIFKIMLRNLDRLIQKKTKGLRIFEMLYYRLLRTVFLQRAK